MLIILIKLTASSVLELEYVNIITCLIYIYTENGGQVQCNILFIAQLPALHLVASTPVRNYS